MKMVLILVRLDLGGEVMNRLTPEADFSEMKKLLVANASLFEYTPMPIHDPAALGLGTFFGFVIGWLVGSS